MPLLKMLKRSLLLLCLVLCLMLFSIQPVQGASFTIGPDCNFTSSVSRTRPSSEGDELTKVSIGIYLIDILYLDEIRESFETKFFMQLQWQDPRLAKKIQKSSISFCNIKMDDIWNPEPYVNKYRRLSREFDEIASVNSKGTVTYRQVFDAELVSPLDFTKYPFDTQDATITILLLPNQPEKIKFVENQEINKVFDQLSFVGWSVGEVKTRTGLFTSKLFPKPLPRFTFEVEIKRQSKFFVKKAIFPLLILIFAVYLIFWLEPAQLIPRVSLSSIILLSVIAYELNLPSQLPRVPYLTAADTFLIGLILLIVLALTATIVTYKLTREEQKSLALSIDIWLRWLFPLFLLGLIGLAFL